MQLARVETQSALTRSMRASPDLALAHAGPLDWIGRLGIRGPKTLPLRLNALAPPGGLGAEFARQCALDQGHGALDSRRSPRKSRSEGP